MQRFKVLKKPFQIFLDSILSATNLIGYEKSDWCVTEVEYDFPLS